MKTGRIIILFCLMLIGITPAFSQEGGDTTAGTGNGIALFAGAGFGIAYNVYMEDAQNELVDVLEAGGFTEDKDKSSGAWGYGVIGLEPRYTSGNVVYGLPLAFYNLSDSKRVAVNGGTVVESEMVLSIWSASCMAYYKINRPDSNYLLLGGGLGVYIGTITWNHTVFGNDSDTKWTIGWQTGIEYHWVWGNVDVYAGLTSRFAEVLNFKVNSDDGKNNMIAGLTGLNFSAGAGYRF